MQIVADRGMDLPLSTIEKYHITLAPLYINLDGKTYASGIDIDSKGFYQLLSKTKSYPQTSMPSPGDFAELFKKLAQKDREILYIHISAGLSGTSQAAKQGAQMVPEANITFFDSKTLSCPYGWQVEAAAKTYQMGWSLPEILNYLKSIRLFSNGMFTLNDLSYLINGGRISHLKGLVATALQLKPIIKVDKGSGKYIDAGRGRTMKGAIRQIATLMMKMYGEGAKLRIQLLHGDNLPAVDMLREELLATLDVNFDETLHIAPVLGAHTGPSMVGLSGGPLELFTNPVRESTTESLLDRLKLPGFTLPLLQESNL